MSQKYVNALPQVIFSLLFFVNFATAITYFDHLEHHRVAYIVSYANGLEYKATDGQKEISGTIDEGQSVKIENFSGPTRIELSSLEGYVYTMDRDFGHGSDDAITLIKGRTNLVDTDFYFFNPIQEHRPRIIITSLADNNNVKLNNLVTGDQEIEMDLGKGEFRMEFLKSSGIFRLESSQLIYAYFGIIDNDNWETIPSVTGELVGQEFYATTANFVGVMPLANGNLEMYRLEDDAEVYRGAIEVGTAIQTDRNAGGWTENPKTIHIQSTVPVFVWVGQNRGFDSSFIPPIPNTGSTQFLGVANWGQVKVFPLLNNTQVDILDHGETSGSKRGLINMGEMIVSDRISDNFAVVSNKPVVVKLVNSDNESAEYLLPADLTPSLLFNHPQFPPSTGQKFSIPIQIFTSANLQNFSFNFSFDPLIVKALDVEYGSFLSKSGVDPTTCETPKIDNGSGIIRGISCQRNTKTGITGSGILVNVNFEAIASGEFILKIQDESFIQPNGDLIEFGFSDQKITIFSVHGEISGRVTDGSSYPISQVSVEALFEGKSVGIATKTDHNGQYLIDNITQMGRISVHASKPGTIPIPPIEVDVTLGQKTEVIDFTIIEPTLLQSVTDYRGFIRNWLVLGLIDWEKEATRLMSDQLNLTAKPDARFPVQETEFKELNPQDGDFGTGLAKNFRWRVYADPQHDDHQRKDQWVRFNDIYRNRERGVAYAFTRVKAPQDMKVTLQTDHGGGTAIWLNSELVHLETDHIGWFPDRTDEVEGLELEEGWNTILIKTDGWELSCRFVKKNSPLSQGEPLTNLEVSPQSKTMSLEEPTGLTRGTFDLELEKGLNMISLPVQPDRPMTAKTLAQEIDATLVIRLDPKNKSFVPFVPEHFEGSNFQIEGGMGVIVNIRQQQTATFTGTVWDNTATAPATQQPVWAFGLVFDSLPVDSTLKVKNLRSGELLHSSSGIPAIAFVDQSQQSVVKLQDWIEIEVKDRRWRYQLTAGDLHQAFALVSLDDRIRIPQQTRLLQNYPNPFNPETWLPFKLAQDAIVTAKIYDVTGKQIRMIQLGHIPAGNYVESNKAIYWDGKTDTGEQVASGTYFYQIDAGDYTETRKMVILK